MGEKVSQTMPIHIPVAPSCRREDFSHTFTHGEGPYATAFRATDRKEYLARVYHPETCASSSVVRDHRRTGRDPHQTMRHWEELDAYRAHHSSEPNMYQTEQERMIADHIRQEAEAALRHSLLLSPAMRSTRTIAALQTQPGARIPSFTNPNGILPRTIASAHPDIYTFRDTLRCAQGILHN